MRIKYSIQPHLEDQMGVLVTEPPRQTPPFRLGSCHQALGACGVGRAGGGGVPACLRGHYFSAVIEERRRGEPRTATRNLTHTGFWPKSNLLVVDKKAATDLIQTKCAVHKPLLA